MPSTHRQRRRLLDRLLTVLICLGLLGIAGMLLLNASGGSSATELDRIRRGFADAGLEAVRFRVKTGAECPRVDIAFTASTIRDHSLLLVSPDKGDYILIDEQGRLSRDGRELGAVNEAGRIVETPDERALSVDGRIVARGLRNWDVFWVGAPGTRPRTEVNRAPVIDFVDGFMRTELLNGDWTLEDGNAELYRHGGGMPRNDGQQRNPSFQRAVNPFTVRTTDHAVLSVGTADWRQFHGEARFYFGVPRTGDVIDRNALPVGTDLLVVQGPADGPQVAFGWRGEVCRYVLMTRHNANQAWRIAKTHQGRRPPLTNWVRIGLQVRAGGRAEGFLDGRKILTAELDRELTGPMHIHTGAALAEFDDVSAWTLPRSRADEAPYFLKSRHFTGKKEKHDPTQFYQWTQATEAFEQMSRRMDGLTHCTIVTTKPLMGTFHYESVPGDEDAGDLPDGRYAFAFAPHESGTPPNPSSTPPRDRILHARRADGLWRILAPDGTADETLPAVFTLRLSRRAGSNARLMLHGPDEDHALFPLPDNQLHVGIARVYEHGVSAFPRPEHHRITCANLTNELFETAPTGWSWIHGAFRMDMRWACEDQWNFMACGSPSTSFMVSKRRYAGDQEHEFYMSLRPMMPWDAGDASWSYDPDADRRNGYKILKRHRGFYIRHDLNFAFCGNGVDPLSGYAVIFGGEDNTRTMLLRKGEIVAETSRPNQLFPTERSHHAVHWKWWGFHVSKYGDRILVDYNGNSLFDYTDPEPLSGGHIGYWTLRNGFTVARAISMAASVSEDPHVLYVPADNRSDWQPLRRDAVHLLQESAELTRVTANVGAGEIAVRHTFDEPVDARQTPILSLPLTLGPDCRINLFIATDRHAGVVQITAPITATKALLTPDAEVGECFRLSPVGEKVMEKQHLLGRQRPRNGILQVDLRAALQRLETGRAGSKITSLTLGNASNTGYLKAGNGGNTAGTWYTVGRPTFKAETADHTSRETP